MTLKTSNIRPLAQRLSALAGEQFGDEVPEPDLDIDVDATLNELTVESVKSMERLAPFGAGNRRPVLAVRGVKIAGNPRRMGTKRQHVSFPLVQGDTSLRAVWWNGADRMDEFKGVDRCDVAFGPKVNTYRGTTSVELIVKDILPHA